MLHRFKVFLITLIVLQAFVVEAAWAINPPEPKSGGRFFVGKGTRAATEHPYDEQLRTEYGSFDQHHYGKGLQLGIVRVEPTLGYTGEYDSNIFLTEDDAKGDYISRLLGGINAYVPMQDGKYLLTAGVQSKTEWFAKNGNENHTDWTYQLGGEVNFEAFKLAVHDEFKDTTDRSDNELTQRIDRFENRLQGLLTVPFNQFFSETEVSDFILDFRNNAGFELFDRREFSVFPRFGMDVGPRTQALVEYGFTNIAYDNLDDRDGVAHQGQLGIRGLLGNADLVTYQLWGGWQFRHYDGGNLDGFSGPVGHGELVYKPTELTQFILRAVRRPQESVSAVQSFYTRNEVSLKYRRRIAEKWYASAQGAVGFNHYASDRLDFIWEPGVGIEYVLPGNMLALFTEYKFTSRVSDADNSDYNRHIANFGIKAEV